MREFALQDALGQAAACCMYLFAASGASFPAQCCASALSVTVSAVLLAVYACRATAAEKRGSGHPLELFSKDGLGSTRGREFGQAIDLRALWEFDDACRATAAENRGNGHSLELVSEDGLGSTRGREFGQAIDLRTLWEFDEEYRRQESTDASCKAWPQPKLAP